MAAALFALLSFRGGHALIVDQLAGHRCHDGLLTGRVRPGGPLTWRARRLLELADLDAIAVAQPQFHRQTERLAATDLVAEADAVSNHHGALRDHPDIR